MNRVVHFEVVAENPERAAAFYKTLFGWKIEKWQGPIEYWMVYTGEGSGIDGGIMPENNQFRSGGANAFVCTMDVANIDQTLEAVTKHGGSVFMPKRAIPGVGFMAYCKDTEGNVFGLMTDDPSAK